MFSNNDHSSHIEAKIGAPTQHMTFMTTSINQNDSRPESMSNASPKMGFRMKQRMNVDFYKVPQLSGDLGSKDADRSRLSLAAKEPLHLLPMPGLDHGGLMPPGAVHFDNSNNMSGITQKIENSNWQSFAKDFPDLG